MTRAEQMTADASARVKAWPRMPGPGEWVKCESGGFLVGVGQEFPVWRNDVEGVRRLLLVHDYSVAALPAS